MKNDDISSLRAELFATIRAVRDKENPLEVARARVVADLASQIIDSARVEVEFIAATGTSQHTGFIPQQSARGPDGEPVGAIGAVTRHLIRG